MKKITEYPYKQVWVNGTTRDEHRVVMEQYLGRKLERNEYVHHINGDRKDNRIENLEVMSPAAHNKLHLQIHPTTKICEICRKEFTPHKTKRARNRTCGSKDCWSKIVNRENAKKQRPIVQFNLNGQYIRTWDSGTDIQNKLGFNHPNIVKCCKHQKKSAYGYTWRYEDEVLEAIFRNLFEDQLGMK